MHWYPLPIEFPYLVPSFPQLKNVLFEFVPKEDDDGVFEVHARFMGVRLEHVELDIQASLFLLSSNLELVF